MICLTGDVHHDTLDTNEQRWLRAQGRDISEVGVAVEYTRLCEKHGVKCTLYTTGKTLARQWDGFRPVADSPLVELGGHTYGGLPRSPLARLRARLVGRVSLSHAAAYPSRGAQQRDVQKMVQIGRTRLGKDIVSWRSHGLVRDEHTEAILAAAGIRFISDELHWGKRQPERTPAGLMSHPMNVIMDHDHLYHAHRTRAYVARQQQNWTFTDDPTRESYDIDEWGRIVEQQVTAIEAAGGIATVLMHPLCMYVADEFRTMEALLEKWAGQECIWAREVEPCMV